jgi:hypothetical protein
VTDQFFAVANATDQEYATLATSDWTPAREARHFIEATWPRVAEYLDKDFIRKAARRFHPHFWEMYLASTLERAGLPLVRRRDRRGPDDGPDLLLTNGIAVEAVTAMSGLGPDAVQEGELGVARSVPDAEISLRLLNALDEKRKRLQRYHETAVLSAGSPFVIALNAAKVPSARLEISPPRIVRALFGIGHLEVRLSVETLEITGSSYARREVITKASGADVRADAFLMSEAFNGVSAVIYSCVDSVNRPSIEGGDFIVVHNPNAVARISIGELPGFEEYFVEDGKVRSIAGSLAPDV